MHCLLGWWAFTVGSILFGLGSWTHAVMDWEIEQIKKIVANLPEDPQPWYVTRHPSHWLNKKGIKGSL